MTTCVDCSGECHELASRCEDCRIAGIEEWNAEHALDR